MDSEYQTAVIAVSTAKGGTGKTTTACNLAAGLAFKSKYEGGGGVVLIDLDPQGDASKFFGVQDHIYHRDRNPSGPCISKVLLGEAEVADSLIELRDHLYLLPSSEELKYVATELTVRQMAAMSGSSRRGVVPIDKVLRHRLEDLIGAVEFIVIDCPPNLGVFEPAVFDFAEHVVAPVQLQYLSTAGVAQHTETLARLVKEVGAHSKLLFVVPTMVSLRDGQPWQVGERQMLESITRTFGKNRVAAPVPDSVLVEQSPGLHQSIFEYAAKDTAPVQAYGQLVNRVYQYVR